MLKPRWKTLLVTLLVVGPVSAPFFVSSTLDGWLHWTGTLYMVAALVAVLWEIVARLQAAGRLKGAISFRRRRMADTVGVAAGSSEVPAVGDFDKPDKLEDRLVLLEYWKAVAAQRETEARQALTDARARHERDLAEIRDELKKTKMGSLSLDLLAALLVGLSIGFTVAADWWAA
jgi:hypothetical protein